MKEDWERFRNNGGIANLLTGSSLLAFYFVCILLPLVGQSGKMVGYYGGKNVITFLSAVVLGFILAASGFWLKQKRRSAHPDEPFPKASLGMATLFLIIFFLQLSGLLAI